jgi:hypothetical protein
MAGRHSGLCRPRHQQRADPCSPGATQHPGFLDASSCQWQVRASRRSCSEAGPGPAGTTVTVRGPEPSGFCSAGCLSWRRRPGGGATVGPLSCSAVHACLRLWYYGPGPLICRSPCEVLRVAAAVDLTFEAGPQASSSSPSRTKVRSQPKSWSPCPSRGALLESQARLATVTGTMATPPRSAARVPADRPNPGRGRPTL